jgi:flavin-dependent dehydrogenase
VTALRRAGGSWIVNEAVASPVIVGAGGHGCPVARLIRPPVRHGVVIAREIELRLSPGDHCAIQSDTPELYFSRDLEGYGWCLRKGDYLNVGIGRRTAERFDLHVQLFALKLTTERIVPSRVLEWRRWRGHAYLLAGAVPRPPIADGLVLVGDAAGLASGDSGEGIGPAVESALLAAHTLTASRGQYDLARLQPYADALRIRPAASAMAHVRSWIPAAVGRRLMSSPRFTRRVLTRWFVRPARLAEPGSTAAPYRERPAAGRESSAS